MACIHCNDTGVIETGNNDFPCSCPAGDRAEFNVAGSGRMTGAQLKSHPAHRFVAETRKSPEVRLEEAKRVLLEWTGKQGHDACWYYPELFTKLCKILGVAAPLPTLPSRYEFERGCKRYQDQLYPPPPRIPETPKCAPGCICCRGGDGPCCPNKCCSRR